MVLTIVESSFWSPWRGKKTTRQCLFINAESLQYDLIGNKSVHGYLADNGSPGNASTP